jgi:hypothetical protein
MPSQKSREDSPRKDDQAESGVMAPEPITPPSSLDPTPDQWQAWREGAFRRKVQEAVADWAYEPASDILPSNTLGDFAKGTPRGEGQQGNPVRSLNGHKESVA